MLISILKGQYDSFTGNEDMIFLKQRSFEGKWKDLLVFVERNDKKMHAPTHRGHDMRSMIHAHSYYLFYNKIAFEIIILKQ